MKDKIRKFLRVFQIELEDLEPGIGRAFANPYRGVLRLLAVAAGHDDRGVYS